MDGKVIQLHRGFAMPPEPEPQGLAKGSRILDEGRHRSGTVLRVFTDSLGRPTTFKVWLDEPTVDGRHQVFVAADKASPLPIPALPEVLEVPPQQAPVRPFPHGVLLLAVLAGAVVLVALHGWRP